ncbi:MAG: hypothetical protein ACEQSB_00390 [Undibacterium sp.]
MKKSVKGRAIQTGLPWNLRISLNGHASFPINATFESHIRRNKDDVTPLVILTTANGGVVRTGSKQISLSVSAAQSSNWTEGSVYLDVVRTDGDRLHLGFALSIYVNKPITRFLV